MAWIDDRTRLRITADGQELVVSPFNAARIFAALAFMLGISLPAALGRKLKL